MSAAVAEQLEQDAAAAGYLEALRAADAGAGAAGHDECFGPAAPRGDAAPEEAWEPVLAAVQQTPHAELRRRWERAKRMIADHGVTYRAYGDRAEAERPWRLDPVPVVIGPAAWDHLRRGLEQRARLLEAVLRDLHGPAELIAQAVVPAALILGNPGLFRPLRGLEPPGGRYLSLLAVDVGRDAAGRWCVIGDRSSAPGGVGHALEHRVVVSRTLPTAFRRSRPAGLGDWFEAVRAYAQSLAPASPAGEPRVVLLTPGPEAVGHAEHAYLARSLGFTLVEPDDLTVRRREVFLKTLAGLQKVDVIVRRLPDCDCDPLELGPARGPGVPGLLEAQRAGSVAVTNAPGSGLVESPGLGGYLPAACRFLLGEEILLPPAATRWCGAGGGTGDDAAGGTLARSVVKPAYAGPLTPGIGPSAAVFGTTAGDQAGSALREAIAERPGAFAVQEAVTLSTTPVWTPESPGLVPRRLVIRAFVAATAGGGWSAMPGGLGRVTGAADSRLTSMRRGGGAKDVWVVRPAGEAGASPLPAADRAPETVRGLTVRGGAVAPAGRGASLPSRVADNLFWLGRYTERAEGNVRLLRAIGHRHADPAEPHPREMAAMLRALAVVTGVAEAATADRAAAAQEPASDGGRDAGRAEAGDVLSAILDPRGPHGLTSTLAACRAAGSRVRDRLSVDAWRILERLGRGDERELRGGVAGDPEDALADAMELFDGLLLTLAAFAGHSHESFTHEEGWRFLDLGRRIERAVTTAELMRSMLVRPVWLGGGEATGAGPGPAGRASASEGLLLGALLEVGVSAMTYRSRHRALPRIVPVLELLLLDPKNPRSVVWQLHAIEQHLADLPDAPGGPHPAGATPGRSRHHAAAEAAGRLLAEVSGSVPAGLAAVEGGRREALATLLERVVTGLPGLSDEVSRAYVRLTPDVPDANAPDA
ncbi:circularly permuted type 2 ATP-grasp protein [Phycisphaera mikurensis]|uniref:Uncharacterized protein n=1 Tax=Phycisphaera mikurensis (strain NBRC 102666 / KCTC 22515 / FYK2301M01) TaxID=1142394 RepID=I0IHC7_PHYMF|nr:circularly permuted type 2 ATP-grasp protein [Phycisphaera mikurensis]MBB6440914.1 putative circularly permuted ATP-grasp superfamily protein/putative alpha-E superfamily protein [Phycisphaera mikurensis]BAM04665.1 hypothetical protein PSMK_25060 [Phycisphaera mikurensis NBRC 102666]